jgi:eukaryotic-like serine/threonine-protein kinase
LLRGRAEEAGGASSGLASGCLDPEQAIGFVQGWLSADKVAGVEAHIDRCVMCRLYVAELAKVSSANAETLGGGGSVGPEPPREAVEPPLARGSGLGRYVIDGLLGTGAMGIVYAAYDPHLDRKVAIKVLRREAHDGRGTLERVMREARAMARLSHPNVVAVHDVGVHEGRPFLAMEYIDGITLRSWLRREARTPREVLRVLVWAGRGLSAAHAAGVVHRDVKPDNVLIAKDGRVCMTDFGLARAARPATPVGRAGEGHDEPRPAGAPRGPLGSETLTGLLIGTPAYMAPEQSRGQAADAASDQFSFCLMACEALGLRPFGPPAPSARGSARAGGASGSSSRVHRVLLRGLRAEPEGRFRSMAHLLAELSRASSAAATWRARALVAVGALASLGAAGYLTVRPGARPDCQAAARGGVAGWSEGRKVAVREALLAAGSPFAPDVWRRVEGTLDAYARDWAHERVEVCEATRVRGEQTEELLALRVACLDERASELAALTEVFARADQAVVLKASQAVRSLTPPSSCGDRKALLEGRRGGEALGAEFRDKLAKASALMKAGKPIEGLPFAAEAVSAAEAGGAQRQAAQAMLLWGQLLGKTGDLVGAEAALRRASLAADAAGDDALRARVLVMLLFYVGYLKADHGATRQFDEQIGAVTTRAGGVPEVDALRHLYVAHALRGERRLDEALREAEAAVPLLEKVFGPESPEAISGHSALGAIHTARGEYSASEASLRRALELGELTLGPRHPFLVDPVNSLGVLFGYQVRFDEAEPYFARALQLMQDTYGPEAPVLEMYLTNLGEVLNQAGRPERALPFLRRALPLVEGQLPPDHPHIVMALSSLGRAHLELGDRAQAVDYLERALRVRTNAEGLDSRAQAQFALAKALSASPSGRARRRAVALALAARDSYREAEARTASPLVTRDRRRVEEWLARRGGR